MLSKLKSQSPAANGDKNWHRTLQIARIFLSVINFVVRILFWIQNVVFKSTTHRSIHASAAAMLIKLERTGQIECSVSIRYFFFAIHFANCFRRGYTSRI